MLPDPASLLLAASIQDQVPLLLVLAAGLFLLGAIGEIAFAKLQIPDVVWLIAAGFILRATGLAPMELLGEIQPLFAALTLIIVLFEGGTKLVVADLVKSAPRALLLSALSFIGSTIAVAVVTMGAAAVGMLEDWTWGHAIMVGSIVGGSSSLIIMPVMQLAKVEADCANLVSLESALTDALCVVVTVAMIGIVVSGEADAGSTIATLGKNFGIALGIGVAAGWCWFPVLRLLKDSQHAYPVTLAAIILLYVVVEWAGGSAAMGIITFAVLVGNADTLMKRVGFKLGDTPLAIDPTVVAVHEQVSFIIKSFFFTFIGIMLWGSISKIILGVLLGLVLLAARIPATLLSTKGAGFTPTQVKLITISMPRGMAAGVLATMPLAAGISAESVGELPAMIFACVVTTIVIFAVGFRRVRSEMPAPPPGQAEGQPPPEGQVPQAQPGQPLPEGAVPEGALPPGGVAPALGEGQPPPERIGPAPGEQMPVAAPAPSMSQGVPTSAPQPGVRHPTPAQPHQVPQGQPAQPQQGFAPQQQQAPQPHQSIPQGMQQQPVPQQPQQHQQPVAQPLPPGAPQSGASFQPAAPQNPVLTQQGPPRPASAPQPPAPNPQLTRAGMPKSSGTDSLPDLGPSSPPLDPNYLEKGKGPAGFEPVARPETLQQPIPTPPKKK